MVVKQRLFFHPVCKMEFCVHCNHNFVCSAVAIFLYWLLLSLKKFECGPQSVHEELGGDVSQLLSDGIALADGKKNKLCAFRLKRMAERGFVCRSVELYVVRRRKCLRKCNLVLSMFGDLVSKAHENGVIEHFGLTARLWMTCCYCQMFNTMEGAYRSKQFADELRIIFSEDVH